MKLITMVHMENNQSKQQLQQDHIHMDYDGAMDFHLIMNSYLYLIPLNVNSTSMI